MPVSLSRSTILGVKEPLYCLLWGAWEKTPGSGAVHKALVRCCWGAREVFITCCHRAPPLLKQIISILQNSYVTLKRQFLRKWENLALFSHRLLLLHFWHFRKRCRQKNSGVRVGLRNALLFYSSDLNRGRWLTRCGIKSKIGPRRGLIVVKLS